MVKILIKDATIFTLSSRHDLLIDRGYVFIKDGTIAGVGKGEPPEDLQYPELLINGNGRLVMPGLSSAITSVTLYPLRYRLGGISWSEVGDYLSVLTRTDVYYLAALTFVELVTRGVSSVMVTDIYLDNVARAASDVGIYATLAVPFDCGIKDFNPESELKLLINRWHGKVEGIKAAILTCREDNEKVYSLAKELGIKVFVLKPPSTKVLKYGNVVCINPAEGRGVRVVRFGDDLSRWTPDEGLGIGVRPSYSMLDVVREVTWRTGKHPLDVLVSSTLINTSLIGFDNLGAIDVGSRANIVMFNMSEPPGWPIPSNINSIVKAVVEGDLRVESLIVNDDVVVDAGETLNVGADLIKKAVSRLEPVIKKYYALGKN